LDLDCVATVKLYDCLAEKQRKSKILRCDFKRNNNKAKSFDNFSPKGVKKPERFRNLALCSWHLYGEIFLE